MRAGVSIIVAAALVLGLSSASAALKPGSLDPRFGTGGLVHTSVTTGYDYASRLAVQGDGKIVVGGGTDDDFLLLRYNANGKLDTGFGSGGKVITDFNGGADAVRGLAIQPNGRIIAGGFAELAGVYRFALARYNANGSLDTTFGTGGKVTTSFASASAFGEGIALQSNGKVVVAGGVLVGATLDTGLARYNSSGTLDSTFGAGGTVVHDLGGGHTDIPYALIGLPDGTSVAGGLVDSGTSFDMLVARFDASGNLVLSFGEAGGVVRIEVGAGADRLSSLARLPNGDIVGGGYAGTGMVDNPYDSALIFLTSEGALDDSFSGDGKATFSVGKSDVLDGIVVVPGLFPQSPARIAGSGSAFDVDHYDCSALVVNLDGSLDAGFGTNGILKLPFSSNEDYCGVPGLADRGIGGRDLLLFGGEELSTTHARIIGAEVFVDPVHSKCSPKTCRFFKGTSKRDTIMGTRGRDYILGNAGNDVLLGHSGADFVDGGAGNDWLYGDAGRDLLRDFKGRNHFDGGPGKNTCKGKGTKKRCRRK